MRIEIKRKRVERIETGCSVVCILQAQTKFLEPPLVAAKFNLTTSTTTPIDRTSCNCITSGSFQLMSAHVG